MDAVRLTQDGTPVIVLHPADAQGVTVMRLSDDAAEITRIADTALGSILQDGSVRREILARFDAAARGRGYLFHPSQPLTVREGTSEGPTHCYKCKVLLSFEEGSLGCTQCRYYVCRCGRCLCGYTGVNYKKEYFRQFPPLSIARRDRVDCVRVARLCAGVA
jgi:hypothetical protein